MKLDESDGLRITVVGKGPQTWQWSVFSGPPGGQFEKQHGMGRSPSRNEAYQQATGVSQQIIWNAQIHGGHVGPIGPNRLLPIQTAAPTPTLGPRDIAELAAKFDKEYPEEDE